MEGTLAENVIILKKWRLLIENKNRSIGKVYLPDENVGLKDAIVQIDDLKNNTYLFDEKIELDLKFMDKDKIYLFEDLPKKLQTELKKELILYRLANEGRKGTMMLNIQKGRNSNGRKYDFKMPQYWFNHNNIVMPV